jgi:hypothetical protein
MARNLLRIYLYLMCIGLLGFLAYALFTLLEYAFGASVPSPIPGLDQPMFGFALLGTSLVLCSLLGGLHYWGIRRDMAEDPEAATGSVRAIMLNSVQGVAAAFLLFAGLLTFVPGTLAASEHAELQAITVVALVGFILVQVERRRPRPHDGVPIGAQRTHLSVMLIVALLTLVASWLLLAVPLLGREFVVSLFGRNFGGHNVDTGNWVGLLWVAAVLAFYIWLARGDNTSLRRLTALLASFLLGLTLTIVGVWGALDWLLRPVFQVSRDAAPPAIRPAWFLSLFIFGLIALLGYTFWLIRDESLLRLGPEGTRLTLTAISTFTLGVAFYVALILLAQSFLPSSFGQGQTIFAAALLIPGLVHPVLLVLLRRWSLKEHQSIPFEGYDLMALFVGGLTTVIFVTFTILSLFVRGADVIGRVAQCLAGSSSSGTSGTTTSSAFPSVVSPLIVVIVALWVTILHGWLAYRGGFLSRFRFFARRQSTDGETLSIIESYRFRFACCSIAACQDGFA